MEIHEICGCLRNWPLKKKEHDDQPLDFAEPYVSKMVWFGWMDACMDAWIHGCMDTWMHECIHSWMDVCMHACMHGIHQALLMGK